MNVALSGAPVRVGRGADFHADQDPGSDSELVAHLSARIAARAIDLPMLPETVQRALQMASREDCDARALANLVRGDATLSAHVLKIANSAVYSRGTPIVSLQQALGRLGLNQLKGLLLMLSCDAKVFRVPGREALVRGVFRRSLVCSLFAQETARLLRQNVEEAFLVGLLHDVGRPIVLQAIVDWSHGDEHRLDGEREGRLVARFHAEIGADLLETWNLPRTLVETVRHQDTPSALTDPSVAWLLRWSDQLAGHALATNDSVDEKALHEHESLAALRLYEEDVASLIGKKREILEKAGSLT